MKSIKIVTKANSIQFIHVMRNEEYLNWKEEKIKSEILSVPSDIITDFIPNLSEWEIDQIKKLGDKLSSKILYDYLILNGQDESFILEISDNEIISEECKSIQDLKDIMDDSIIRDYLINNYDAFMVIHI